jgi:hypothetical protein
MSRPYFVAIFFLKRRTTDKNKNVISRAVKNWTRIGIKKKNKVVYTALGWREKKRD